MPLQKGFLKSKFESAPSISKYRLIIGIQIGLFWAVSFYLFALVIRDTYRFLSISEEFDFWYLTDNEILFYNVFYSFLSLIIGQSICIAYLFHGPKKMFSGSQRLRINIIHDQHYLTLNFLNWFAKLATFIGFLYCIGMKGGHYYFDILEDYYFLFILFLLALYFHSWITLRRIFKRKSLKIMFLNFGIFMVLSFALAQLNPISIESLNKYVLSRSIYHNYNLELPSSDIAKRLENKSLVFKLYICTTKNESKPKPVIIAEGEVIQLEEIETQIRKWRNWLYEFEHYRITIQLFIDSNIPMGFVYEVRKELSKSVALKIAYTVMPHNPEYDRRFYSGNSIITKIPPYYDDYQIIKWDSEKIDNTPNLIKVQLPEKGDSVLYNNILVGYDKLSTLLRQEIYSNAKKYVILLMIDDGSDYNAYISAISSMRIAVNELRQLYSTIHFGQNYDDLDYDKRKEIQLRFPLKIMEVFEAN